MTHGSEPSDSSAPESLSSDSERRRWQHKRAQFDSAINTARLLGVVQNLALGSMSASEALRIVLEVNSSKDQAQYVAEMLAMKKEFRDLARIDYSDEVAKFILDGSRLLPSLTGGLASQMLMAMGHAAQNDAYLETVSSGVSALLSDLDHPLMPDARNYLRLLWDQMEATRRLKQTEALYTGQRPVSDRAAERRSSGALAAAKPAPVQAPPVTKTMPAEPERSHASRGVASPARTMIGLGQAPLLAHPEASEHPAPESPKRRWVEAAPIAEQPAAAERPSPAPAATSADKLTPPSRPASSTRWVVAEQAPAETENTATPPIPEQQAQSPEPATTGSTLNMLGRVWREARTSPEPVPVTEVERGSASRLAVEPEARREPSKLAALSASAEHRPSSPGVAFEPTLLQHEQDFFAAGEYESAQATEEHAPVEQATPPAYRPVSDTLVDAPSSRPPSRPIPSAPPPRASQTEIKVPTHGVSKWAVASVVVLALAGSGLVLSLALKSESENKSESPKGSASDAKATAPSAKAAPAASLARRPPRANAHPSAVAAAPPPPPPTPTGAGAPPPPPPLPAAEPEPRLSGPSHRASPRNQEPASAPVHQNHVASAPAVAPQVQHHEPAPTPEPSVKKPAAEPSAKSPSIVTPPEVAKSLSPLDRIIAELRLISPDPVGIEDKARELARIIAKSKRVIAGQIIEKLAPAIAVDPLSRDSTLEDSLQTFAISVLGRVATDDDDNRAVDALLMLGEWVHNGGKGKTKALSALQTLSHEPIVKTSAPRLRALKTAQAQAD